jgi:uncharacterized membrane protein (UPF0127 family)
MSELLTVQDSTHSLARPIQARRCASYLCRLRGYMFRKRIDPNEGLLFIYSRESRVDTSIHMLFVFTDLAVFWLDSQQTVVDKVLAKSWRPAYAPGRGARYILEAHSDHLGDFQIGEKVELIHA